MHPIAGTNQGEDPIVLATTLDGGRALVSTREGALFVFDGTRLDPWPEQLRHNLTGRVTSLRILADGGVAVAIAGRGLYLVGADGELMLAMTSSEYHRITQLATREPGVLWAAGEDGIQKILYGSPLTVFGQRLGLNPSWPTVARWNDTILVASSGRLF